jgi:hypothetical protein
MAMFHMANDSHLFYLTPQPPLLKGEGENVSPLPQGEGLGEGLLPLYEAKMFHQFDHRWATYDDPGDTNDVTLQEKCNPSFAVIPRYWVDKTEVENRLAGKWDKEWLLGFRRITNVTNERTFILSIISQSAGDNVFLMIPKKDNSKFISCLCANLNSLVFDFVTRQKMGGTNLNFRLVLQSKV